MTQLKLGFIGLGKMGGPMARRLIGASYDVTVYDSNAEVMSLLLEAGAHPASSPLEVASSATVVFTCLPSLEAVRQVSLGESGLCHGKTIKTLIDCSTTGPEFARTLAGDLAKYQIRMLDAPVSGGVLRARDGELAVMISGEHGLFDELSAVFEPIGRTFYVGESSGQAQMMKLLNNHLSHVMMVGTYETFVLGVKAGLDPDMMVEVLNAGTARNHTTLYRMPRAILPRTFDFGANMEITYKDSCLVMEEADRLGVTMLVGNMANQLWRHGVYRGGAKRDSTTLITYLEEWAGVKVVGAAGRNRA